MNKEAYHIAIVGATGAVGMEILHVLEQVDFPIAAIRLLASTRSVGKLLSFHAQKYPVELLTQKAFEGVDIAFFCAGAACSREFVPVAQRAGALIIDNSSAFRMQENVPLVVPEVNAEDLSQHQGLIANPNCSAAILAVAVWPIHLRAKIRRMIVSTYQAASGAGARAMVELEGQVREHIEKKPLTRSVFAHPIAFNLFSHDSPLAPNGYNGEENKIIAEIRKMFHAPEMEILPTCVRVPVLRAHSESVVLDLEEPLTEQEAREILENAPGVKVVDSAQKNHFPMPIEATGQFDVLVGRIRQSLHDPRALALFISGDQLLKGAAWNAVQIAQTLMQPKEVEAGALK